MCSSRDYKEKYRDAVMFQECRCRLSLLLTAEKLEWGNYDHISNIIEKHPVGFDLILGADIYILPIFLLCCGFFFPILMLYLSTRYVIYQSFRFVDLDSWKASGNLAFPVYLILWRIFFVCRPVNVDSYWLMYHELKSWMRYYPRKLKDVECLLKKWMGQEQPSQISKVSYSTSPSNDAFWPPSSDGMLW